MSNLETIVSTIAVAGAVGAFVDFYIGSQGQKKIREALATLWLKLGYMTVHDVARHESMFAKAALVRIFGPRMFSRRRFGALALVVFAVICYAQISLWLDGRGGAYAFSSNDHFALFTALAAFMIRAAFSLSISIFMAEQIGKRMRRSISANVLLLLLLVVIQVLIVISALITHRVTPEDPIHGIDAVSTFSTGLVVWLTMFFSPLDHGVYSTQFILFVVQMVMAPIYLACGMFIGFFAFLAYFSDLLFTFIPSSASSICYFNSPGMDLTHVTYASIGCTDYLIGFVRLAILLFFFATLAAYPFRRVVMKVWLRVIESDKPIFTMALGFSAAMVKAFQEAAKLF